MLWMQQVRLGMSPSVASVLAFVIGGTVGVGCYYLFRRGSGQIATAVQPVIPPIVQPMDHGMPATRVTNIEGSVSMECVLGEIVPAVRPVQLPVGIDYFDALVQMF